MAAVPEPHDNQDRSDDRYNLDCVRTADGLGGLVNHQRTSDSRRRPRNEKAMLTARIRPMPSSIAIIIGSPRGLVVDRKNHLAINQSPLREQRLGAFVDA